MSSAKLQGGASGTGSVTLLAPNTNNTDVLTLPDVAADTLVGAAATQTLTNKTLGSGLVAGASYLTSGTAVASTSGTSIDFTSIPSWVKRITVMFNGVSTSGTSIVMLQIGSGSVVSTGYLGAVTQSTATNTPIGANFSTGFQIDQTANAAGVRYGQIILTLLSGNTWVEAGTIGRSDNATNSVSNGVLALSGTLDRVRITTVNGTDTFDAGSINILWE